MMRTRSIAHQLSPNTAQDLVNQFSAPHYQYQDNESLSSESPDSLYSNASPTFPDQAFEYDTSTELDVEERDEDDYESILDSASAPTWETSNWNRWPEAGLDNNAGWTPSPKSFERGPRSASIISISPGGSFSATGSGSIRRPSIPSTRLPLGEPRKDSNPSLLGFDLAQRRHSSLSLSSPTRQSSIVSNGSVADSVEDQRLRNFASMDLIRRRFSEAVEVTLSPEQDHTSMARAALVQLQSPWTPDIYSDDEDSEVMTAPYVPTPDLPHHQPTLLSNYPLPSSVRAEPIDLGTPDISRRGSTVIPPEFTHTARRLFSTPPAPSQPLEILRTKKRPIPGFDVDYQFPPRSAGVPEGAGPPRPGMNRTQSTPFLSVAEKAKPVPPKLKRAAGSFPIAREMPIGISPLRSSTRRVSTVHSEDMQRSKSAESKVSLDVHRETLRRQCIQGADGMERSISTDSRASLDVRRCSAGSRRLSVDSRPPSVAERRISIVLGITPPRKLSADARRTSSIRSGSAPRRTSKTSLALSRGSTADSLHSSRDRRSSSSTRKSSVVSVGEYGYLGPQIVIDVVETPRIPASGTISTTTPVSTPPRLRSNAPTSIPLPSPFHPPVSGMLPPTSSGSIRFNPLESFLGLTPSVTPSPPSTDLFTPRSELSTPFDATPRQGSLSIMDRPRPISPPEYRYPFPGISRLPSSPQSFRSQLGSGSGSGSDHNESDAPKSRTVVGSPKTPELNRASVSQDSSPNPSAPRLGVVRKAVPQLTAEEVRQAHLAHMTRSPNRLSSASQRIPTQIPSPFAQSPARRFERRGAVEQFTSGDESLPCPSPHRRTISVEHQQAPREYRPAALTRQNTFDHAYSVGPPSARFAFQVPGGPAPSRPRLSKQPSVTFVEVDRVSRPVIQRAVSTSSFSRFFSSKSKPSKTASSPVKPLKSSMKRMTLEDATSSGSEQSLVEVKDMISQMADGPYPHPTAMGMGSRTTSPRSPKNGTVMLY